MEPQGEEGGGAERVLTILAAGLSRAGHEVRLERLRPAEDVHQQILEERQEMEQAEHYHGLYDDRLVKPGAKFPGRCGFLDVSIEDICDRAQCSFEGIHRAQIR